MGSLPPRDVLYAISEALFDDSSLKGGVPAEKIAEQLVVRGYLHEEPPLALVKQMLEVLEEGSIGLRSPTLQPCALETYWDAEAGHLRRNIDLSMSINWIGAPSEWWDRTMPKTLTHAKTPPCTDLLSETVVVLSNRERWPIHICDVEFTRQSTELWAEAQPFEVDSVNVHRWAAMYPLPIGRLALMAHPDVQDLSAWSEVLDILPFDEYERAIWALRVEHQTAATVHTLDLFGLPDYSTSNLAEYVAGSLAFSVSGTGRFLIDVLDAAERWWAQFRGISLRGRPKGTGTWPSPEHFANGLDLALADMRSREEKVTQESLARRLGIHKKTLDRWLQLSGRSWSEIRNS